MIYFLPLLGDMIQFDEHMFQMGRFNHQLVTPIFKAIVAGFRGFQLPKQNRTQKAFQVEIVPLLPRRFSHSDRPCRNICRVKDSWFRSFALEADIGVGFFPMNGSRYGSVKVGPRKKQLNGFIYQKLNGTESQRTPKLRSSYLILRFVRGPWTVGPVGDFLRLYKWVTEVISSYLSLFGSRDMS